MDSIGKAPYRLFTCDELSEWRIFIGRTRQPEHQHTAGGLGPILIETGGRLPGITQVSWTLGRVLVIAIRLHHSDQQTPTSNIWFKLFVTYNRESGTQVRPVPPRLTELPAIELLPELDEDDLTRLLLFYTPGLASPIAGHVETLNAVVAKG